MYDTLRVVTRVTVTSMGVCLPRQRLLTVIGWVMALSCLSARTPEADPLLTDFQAVKINSRKAHGARKCFAGNVPLRLSYCMLQQRESVILDFLVESPVLLRSAVAMFVARWLFRDGRGMGCLRQQRRVSR
jgi:hypothetical protein